MSVYVNSRWFDCSGKFMHISGFNSVIQPLPEDLHADDVDTRNKKMSRLTRKSIL